MLETLDPAGGPRAPWQPRTDAESVGVQLAADDRRAEHHDVLARERAGRVAEPFLRPPGGLPPGCRMVGRPCGGPALGGVGGRGGGGGGRGPARAAPPGRGVLWAGGRTLCSPPVRGAWGAGGGVRGST